MQTRLLLHPGERSRFILSTLKHLCREPRFRHKWRTADDLASLCHKWFTIPEPLQFNGNDLKNALSKDKAMQLDIKAEKSSPNQFGIYHDTHRPKDSNRRSHCYFLCDPANNECVINPPVGKKWYDTIEDISNEIQALGCATRTQQEQERQFPADVIDLVSKAKALVQERDNKLENESKTKRRCLVVSSDICEESNNFTETMSANGSEDISGPTPPQEPPTPPQEPELPPGYNIWWYSTEAEKLFNVQKEIQTTVDRLWELIAVLDAANMMAQSYKAIVEDNDADNTMSEHKKESIRMRARYLTQAYRIALDSMPYKSWHDCCQEAINALAAVGIRYIKNSRVLQRWNDEFRQRKRFSNNNKGKRDLPAFLQAHPIEQGIWG